MDSENPMVLIDLVGSQSQVNRHEAERERFIMRGLKRWAARMVRIHGVLLHNLTHEKLHNYYWLLLNLFAYLLACI